MIKDGEKLSDILSMPVKDALGRDLHIDYSDDICNVREILDTTLARRKIFSDSVELQKLTLEQLTHIYTYEQDARMAIKWLDDLYNVMIKCHSHVGCNIHEIQVQKDELQTFQETGKVSETISNTELPTDNVTFVVAVVVVARGELVNMVGREWGMVVRGHSNAVILVIPGQLNDLIGCVQPNIVVEMVATIAANVLCSIWEEETTAILIQF